MPLPADVQTRTVESEYMDSTGAPVLGTVDFEIPAWFTIPELDLFVIPQKVTATIDAEGKLSTTLYCGDDPDLNAPFSYVVTHNFNGGVKGPTSKPILISVTDPPTVQLEDKWIGEDAPGVSNSAVYSEFKNQILQAGINLLTANLKVVLIDDAEVYDPLDVFLSDIPAPNRIATSPNLSGKTIVEGVFDANDVSIAPVGSEIEALALYVDTGTATTSRLVLWVDGITLVPDGGTVSVIWDNGSDRIFRL